MTDARAQAATAIASAKFSGYLGLIAAFEYLNIPLEQMGILTALMIIDFITGVGKQYRIDKKQIKSHLAWLGLMKKVATLIVFLSLALILKGLEIDESQYIKGVLSIFIAAEGYSTLQNVYAIRTGKLLPEFDVISLFLKALGDFIKERIDSAVKVKLPQPQEDKESGK